MQKDLNISFLNDIYGQLLTKRQREVIAQYYDYDLSLQEISDNIGISRQAVLDAIKKGCEQLNEYESKLGVLSLRKSVAKALNETENGNYLQAEQILKDLLK